MNWYKQSQTNYKPTYDPVGDYLYHATTDENIYGIWEEGLRPSEKSHWKGSLGEESLGKVFFTAKPEHARMYPSLRDKKQEKIFTLRIKTSKLPDIKRTPDSADELFVEKVVFPEDLEILWGEQWLPLKSIREDDIKRVGTKKIQEETETI